MDALEAFYVQGPTQFRNELAETLTSYRSADRMTIGGFTDDGYVHFGGEETASQISYQGKSVTTYKINNAADGYLFEYGLDPNQADVYHFYDRVYEDEDYEIAIIIDRNLLGTPYHLTVFDNGLIYADNQMQANFYVHFDYYEGRDFFEFGAEMALYLGNGTSSEVEVIKQPQDIHVNYPSDPEHLTMSVEVNHPEKVISYDWYIGAFSGHGEPVSFAPINSNFSHDRVLTLMSVGCEMSRIPVKCLIRTENSEIFSGVGVIYVDNADEYVPVAFILDYPIMAGETLNLENTPYGTGTITYDENQHDFTFENVNFNNANINSSIESVGFKIQSWASTHPEFNFNFVGNNVWYNQYWEEDHNQGGFGFFFHFPSPSVKPVVNFKGPGDITFIGGTRAISGNVKAHVYCDMNFVGLPNRLSCGIYADDIVVESGASISGVIGGSILSSTCVDYGCGGVIIEEGARVNAIINPGAVSVDETMLFGIRAANVAQIKKAYVSISIIVNYEYFVGRQQMMSPVMGIYSDLGAVEITDSDVNVDIKAIKTPSNSPLTIVNTVYGIGGLAVEIKNSNVNVTIDSYSFINIIGINSGCVEIADSDVDVYACGMRNTTGILGNYQKNGAVSGAVVIKDSKVDVYSEAYSYEKDDFGDPYYVDAGIRAVCFEISLSSDSYVHVKTNRASALVSIFDHVAEDVSPVPEYTPSQIVLDGLKITSEPYEINVNSYHGWSPNEEPNDFQVKYEALYIPGDYTAFVTEITLTNLPK